MFYFPSICVGRSVCTQSLACCSGQGLQVDCRTWEAETVCGWTAAQPGHSGALQCAARGHSISVVCYLLPDQAEVHLVLFAHYIFALALLINKPILVKNMYIYLDTYLFFVQMFSIVCNIPEAFW